MRLFKDAPLGFSLDLWKAFDEQGYLILDKSLTCSRLDEMLYTFDKLYQNAQVNGLSKRNIVFDSPSFASLVDLHEHVGYMYDIYGDSLTLLSSQIVCRTNKQRAKDLNPWHFDGPRVVRFRKFSDNLPLRVKVGIFLTDNSVPNCGNLVIIPGSHRKHFEPLAMSHEDHPSQLVLTPKKGTIILMREGLWHRVQRNRSENPRISIFLEYGPSWIRVADRGFMSPSLMHFFSEEAKIIVRNYQHPNLFIKIPEQDIPIFKRKVPPLRAFREQKLTIEEFGS